MVLRCVRALARAPSHARFLPRAVLLGAAAGTWQTRRTRAASFSLDGEQELDLTQMVRERFTVPVVPDFLQQSVVKTAVHAVNVALTAKLSDAQLQRVSDAIDGVADGISPEERDEIVAVLSDSLDGCGLIPAGARATLINIIVQAMLGDLSVVQIAGSHAGDAVARGLQTLLSQEKRHALAQKINDCVDIPGLSEEQEGFLFQKALDILGHSLDVLIPASWHRLLNGASPQEIQEFKAYLTCQLCGTVTLPFITKEQTEYFVSTAVDLLLQTLFQVYGVENSVLNPAAQLEYLAGQRARMVARLGVAERASQRRIAQLHRKLDNIDDSIRATELEAGTLRSTLDVNCLILLAFWGWWTVSTCVH